METASRKETRKQMLDKMEAGLLTRLPGLKAFARIATLLPEIYTFTFITS